MKLADLSDVLDYCLIKGDDDKDVNAIAYHSEMVTDGAMFFAIEGQLDKGVYYIEKATMQGAKTIVISSEDELVANLKDDVTIIQVEDVRKALSAASAKFYDNPSRKLLTIGVTGTKGKTATTFMIRQILQEAGIKTGIIGTVASGYDENMIPSYSTTPQSTEIHKMMKAMYDAGCKAVVVEVSSQGLMQSRVDDVEFDIGVFTNISPDHIGEGEHKNFQEYLFWKSSLFKKCERAIINIDDEHYEDIIKDSSVEQVVFFGKDESADFKISDIKLWQSSSILGTEYVLRSKAPCGDGSLRKIKIALAGRFNANNSLAAIAVTKSLGIPWSVIDKALGETEIPGRVERINIDTDFTVMVDYAHSGISLKNLMESLREYNPKRIILVFGCGGNRDVNRRYEMGKVAADTADVIIITSDNPRREDPNKIIADIAMGMTNCNKTVLTIPDRKKAIERAMEEGRDGDIVVIAGKGHEAYQIIGSEIRHFDDKEVILSLMEVKQ